MTEQATDWVVELADSGPQEHAAFLQWLSESPRHVEEYLLAAALYKGLDGVDASKEMDLEEILREASFNVQPLKAPTMQAAERIQQTAGSVARRSRRGWLASAATIATLGVAVAWWVDSRDGVSYSTATGELRSVELADGSVVDLNTRSRIDVRYDDTVRTIRLLEGEALFKVAPDAARPFVVYSDNTVIRALGTQFNVYRRKTETAVAVIEGAVKVSTQRLTAGKAIRVSAAGELKPVTSVDPVKVTAWRERRLVFVDDRLADIVAEFNRYNAAPQLRVEGEYASGRELTGVFDAGDPQSLVEFLRNLGEFSVVSGADEILIRER